MLNWIYNLLTSFDSKWSLSTKWLTVKSNLSQKWYGTRHWYNGEMLILLPVDTETRQTRKSNKKVLSADRLLTKKKEVKENFLTLTQQHGSLWGEYIPGYIFRSLSTFLFHTFPYLILPYRIETFSCHKLLTTKNTFLPCLLELLCTTSTILTK